jgi:hypothetical protein
MMITIHRDIRFINALPYVVFGTIDTSPLPPNRRPAGGVGRRHETLSRGAACVHHGGKQPRSARSGPCVS